MTAMSGVGVAAVREQFPMLSKRVHGHPLIYFDSAATAQKPQCVIDAIRLFYEEQYGTVHRAVYALATGSTENYNRVREQVKAFLNAERVEEIIFTRGTTDALNLVARCLGSLLLGAGDEVLLSVLEHHSNIVPWQLICEERGAKIRVIPANEKGELCMESYRKLLGPKCKIVSVAHVANSVGTVNPIQEMSRLAHEAGAKIVVDGAQAVPHRPVDVQALGADFYAFSGHKLYGPTGVGVLYGRHELLAAMPPYQGGGDMIERVTFEGSTFQGAPLKFEAGTPMIAEVLGLGAALTFLEGLGMEAVARHEQELLAHATDLLQGISGLRIIGTAAEKGGIISFSVNGVHPLDIATFLDFKGIAVRTGHHCAQPALTHFGVSSTVRLSFGMYNTHQEVERFVEILDEVLESLR
jgi:cysteine desulfurase/selenocysteine lyase